MKVAPHIPTPDVKIPVSKFVKFIRLMSNCYILPLRYSGDFSEVAFSILHLKTLISILVVSIPFIITIVSWLVIETDFIFLFIEKSMKVYVPFDMAFIYLMFINYIQPFSAFW